MSERQRAEKLAQDFILKHFVTSAALISGHELHGYVTDVILSAEERGEARGFERGRRAERVLWRERKGVSIHGSDGCRNCETGRITLYAASRWCVECENAVERAHRDEKGGEKR